MKGDEWSYRGWTCETYQSVHSGQWCCDVIYSGSDQHGSFGHRRKKEAERLAKEWIDDQIQAAVQLEIE